MEPLHILIGCTGSVASVKIPILINSLQETETKPEIKVIATDHAQHFFKKQELAVPVFTDADEWEFKEKTACIKNILTNSKWKNAHEWLVRMLAHLVQEKSKVGLSSPVDSVADPVLHIEMRRWADVMLIAPLDANTLAKIANGICDNLLTCVVRAWDTQRPLLFAPAMNTFMYEHPITATHVDALKRFGYLEIPCISKKLACGDTGYGAMAEVSTLVSALQKAIFPKPGSSRPTDSSQSCGL